MAGAWWATGRDTVSLGEDGRTGAVHWDGLKDGRLSVAWLLEFEAAGGEKTGRGAAAGAETVRLDELAAGRGSVKTGGRILEDGLVLS
ncbi:MAG: hypothetical protein AB1641_30790 [Thermodesulfobacteriota bacterium]